MTSSSSVARFIDSFKTIWAGGYFEGDPLDPMASSGYGIFGYHSSLYLTYLTCIRPFIGPDTTVLEIGPGRGAWTRALLALQPKRIYAVDVVDPDYSGFWSYVGRDPRVAYIVAEDQSLDGIADCCIDHFFSFGCFCHIRPEMSVEDINSLARKMKSGANGFLMIADYDKFNACMAQVEKRSIWRAFTHRRAVLLRAAFRLSLAAWRGKFVSAPLDKQPRENSAAGSWFHFGVGPACTALEQAGFRIVHPDMEINHRDPVIQFVKR